MSFTEHDKHGVVWTTADGMPCLHAFTTRLGGVSAGRYASLNLGERTGDNPAAVRENYRRLREALGINREEMVFTRQVHGTELRVVTAADSRRPLEDCPACDGLVTNVRELPLIIFSADCIPVLLCDSEAGVIGAVHCGWRSTAGDILGKAVEFMRGLGARPESIRAAIGPGIGACCFETGPTVEPAAGAPDERKFMIDLRAADKERLLRLGMSASHIDVSDECTKCRTDRYWSHRATGMPRGSQISLIMLE
jgi:YfiH family protein